MIKKLEKLAQWFGLSLDNPRKIVNEELGIIEMDPKIRRLIKYWVNTIKGKKTRGNRNLEIFIDILKTIGIEGKLSFVWSSSSPTYWIVDRPFKISNDKGETFEVNFPEGDWTIFDYSIHVVNDRFNRIFDCHHECKLIKSRQQLNEVFLECQYYDNNSDYTLTSDSFVIKVNWRVMKELNYQQVISEKREDIEKYLGNFKCDLDIRSITRTISKILEKDVLENSEIQIYKFGPQVYFIEKIDGYTDGILIERGKISWLFQKTGLCDIKLNFSEDYFEYCDEFREVIYSTKSEEYVEHSVFPKEADKEIDNIDHIKKEIKKLIDISSDIATDISMA